MGVGLPRAGGTQDGERAEALLDPAAGGPLARVHAGRARDRPDGVAAGGVPDGGDAGAVQAAGQAGDRGLDGVEVVRDVAPQGPTVSSAVAHRRSGMAIGCTVRLQMRVTVVPVVTSGGRTADGVRRRSPRGGPGSTSPGRAGDADGTGGRFHGYLSVQARGVVVLPPALRRRCALDRPGAQVEVTEGEHGILEVRPMVAVPAGRSVVLGPALARRGARGRRPRRPRRGDDLGLHRGLPGRPRRS